MFPTKDARTDMYMYNSIPLFPFEPHHRKTTIDNKSSVLLVVAIAVVVVITESVSAHGPWHPNSSPPVLFLSTQPGRGRVFVSAAAWRGPFGAERPLAFAAFEFDRFEL
ncbi:MAG: hypothetical protein AAF202_09935 [Pseudomonadota bacterium]